MGNAALHADVDADAVDTASLDIAIDLPQSLQNLEPRGTVCPQLGHAPPILEDAAGVRLRRLELVTVLR